MDKRIPLSSDPKAFDAVYFNGANRIGWNIIIGCALRPKNVDGFLILKVPGVGLLLSPRLPDTVLFKKEEDLSCFSTDGLTLTPLKPMQLWHLQYNGKMRLSHKPHKKVKVEIDATWESNLPIFNYDTNVLTKNIAKAMSRESWSSQYFKLLKNFHQTHYEQFGELSGKVIIDGVDFKLNMSTMRDHSFGLRREWRAFHRYMLLMFTLADGTCGTVGIVCIPNLFSRMEIGYVYGKDKRLEAVYDVDFDLYNHGETGLPPTDFGLTFFAGGRLYEMKVHVEETTELFLGLTWEARIVEGLCRFSINRVDGWGCVEWMYAHSDGRPFKQTSKHPLAAE
ncbi:uncharacterized protein LOC128998577 isoform X2 [Macrosteles quadrilineatus]|nr:uncharacterized protein LOC128998577 isoform X2 [Macrosteles quadrilineatus]XP_054280752.1 uncharacterized protein LOC128998577 isoform X2 [Macrosteles quadrilineatus]